MERLSKEEGGSEGGEGIGESKKYCTANNIANHKIKIQTVRARV